MQIHPVIPNIIFGLSSVVLIATLGAFASRKFNFKYSYLAPVSLSIYVLVGLLSSRYVALNPTLFICALIGFFDSTVGWQLCLKFNANFSKDEQESMETPAYIRVLTVTTIAAICGYGGYWINNH